MKGQGDDAVKSGIKSSIIVLAAFFLATLMTCTMGKAQPPQKRGPAPFKTMIITYKVTEKLPPGRDHVHREMLYIDAQNNCRREEVVKGGIAHTTLCTQGKCYRMGGNLPNTAYFSKLPADYCSWKEVGAMDFDKAGIYLGDEVIAGQPCKSYRVGHEKISVWNGIVMKNGTDGKSYSYTRVATLVEKDKPLAPQLFSLPPNTGIRSIEELRN
jgi:hypothetical protein